MGRPRRAQPSSWTRQAPEKILAKLIRRNERVLTLMERVVMDPLHPWHDDWGPVYCRDLARLLTPRITATLERRLDANAPGGFVDVERLIFEVGPGDSSSTFDEIDAELASEAAAEDLEAIALVGGVAGGE